MLINNRYHVIRALGEGGFGHAYLATDQQMPSQRKCAIKQLKPMNDSPKTYEVVKARFQREAAILEKLGEDHPQIPRLYAYFSENHQFYLVQEWVDGITLNALVAQQGPQPEAAVRSILAALLPVLTFVHSQGIIHRDIKPDNIILRAGSQQPVLIDFGAVRETMATIIDSQNSPQSSVAIGTPGFMPPEQAAGRPIPSSDLYSLGLVAIFLLTGRLPHSFGTDTQTGEIIWQSAVQHVSSGFVAVLDKAVRSHPRDRFTSAQAMLSALSSLPEATEAPVSPVIPANIHPPSNHLAVPQQYHPLAADSTLKTVAVAPERKEQVGNGSTSTLPKENLEKTDIGNVHTDSASTHNDNSETPRKRFSPLVIGLGVLVIAGGAIASGLSLNQSQNSPPAPQAIESAPIKEKKAKKPNTKEPKEAKVATETQPTLDELPAETTEPEATESIAENAPQAAGGQLTLGSSSGQIPIYNNPSFAAQSPQSGASGDRVTILQQSQGADGTWYRVRFPSGAEGWVSGAYADSSSYSATAAPTPAVSPSAPAPAPSPEASPPPADTSSAQIVGANGAQVNVYSAPSSDSGSPHYGVAGDRIDIINSAQGEDGRTWYEVQFDSGASGWVSGDSVKAP